MKMANMLLPLMLAVLLLGGCNANHAVEPEPEPSSIETITAETAAVKAVTISDTDYSVIRAAGADRIMIFELRDIAKFGKLSFWTDHYVDGVFKEKLLAMAIGQLTDAPEGELTRLYLTAMKLEDNKELWTLGVRQGRRGVYSAKYTALNMTFDSSMNYPLVNEWTETGNGPQALGVIVLDNGKNEMSTSSNVEETIKSYKDVYVLRFQTE
ncbi:hypothetical protein [Paenibacillus montanisoli]|uniref:Lipoprotein n=1 Tax=Paenibacillus montanisoli TaxID=2081970 RepID=A0A328TVU5_9BACL|nr:hypothetical protein [Paenibacillus montanisoli]RAP73623.1 hypothetical protein DL346_25465 [Paenibacillus montanisoli]